MSNERVIIAAEQDVTITIYTQKVEKQPQTIVFPPVTGALVGESVALSATSSSGLPISYASSDETIAAIVDGHLVPLEDGTVTITASQPGNFFYLPATPVSVEVVTNLEEVVLPPQSPGRVYDPDALAYIGAASVNTLKTKESLDNLVKRLKINALWSDIRALWVAAGSTKKLNLKNPVDTDGAYRLTFPSGVGLSGEDDAFYFFDDKYADTHFPASELDPNNHCLFAYVKSRAVNEGNATGTILGASGSGSAYAINKTGRSFEAKIGTSTVTLFSDNKTPFTYTDAPYVSNIRRGMATYIVGGAKKSQSIAAISSPGPAQSIYLAGLNNSGILTGTSPTDITLAGIARNLSQRKAEILYSIISLYVREMGIRKEIDTINYGDSISYGNNASDINTKSWRALVASAKGYNAAAFVSIGATLQSINGSTNAAADRWYPDQYQYGGFIPYNDAVRFIYLSIGINDAKNWTVEQNPLADFDSAYRSLLDKILGLGWPADKIVVLNTGLVDYAGSSTNQPQLPARQSAINNYIQAMCADYGLRFVDVYTAMQQNGGLSLVNTAGGDGLHPNDAGHQVIANAVLAALA